VAPGLPPVGPAVPVSAAPLQPARIRNIATNGIFFIDMRTSTEELRGLPTGGGRRRCMVFRRRGVGKAVGGTTSPV